MIFSRGDLSLAEALGCLLRVYSGVGAGSSQVYGLGLVQPCSSRRGGGWGGEHREAGWLVGGCSGPPWGPVLSLQRLSARLGIVHPGPAWC